MYIIKKNGYYGIVLAEDGDKLFVATPKFKKVFKKAGENAKAYERFLERKNRYGKNRGFVRIKEDEIECIETPDTMKETIARVSALSSTIIKGVSDKEISKANPLTKYQMDEFFSDKKTIKNLIENKAKANKVIKTFKVLSSNIFDMAVKIESLIEGLDTQAIFMNAEAVEDISKKLNKVIKAINSNEVLNTIYTLGESMGNNEEEEFDAEKFMGV